MKKIIQKIISLFISVAMIMFLVIHSYAWGFSTFSGIIIAEDNINVCGIEIKIYSAEPIYDESHNLLYYAETFEKSVYTDIDGNFCFIKPSTYCSYTVNIDTIPAGYGISKHTQFITPARTNDMINISLIDTVETSLVGDDITVKLTNSNGKILYADYKVIPDKIELYNSKYSDKLSYEELKTIDSHIFSGTVALKDKSYEYEEVYDLSVFSVIEKVDFFFSIGSIDEYQKKEYCLKYLDELDAICCKDATEITKKITDYSSPLKVGDSNIYLESNLLNTNIIVDRCITIDLGAKEIDVKYLGTSFAGYESYLNQFINEIRDIYEYFCVDNSFYMPDGGWGEPLQVYVTSGISDPGGTNYLGDGASEIFIKESLVLNGIAYQTIAHEFMHAIMAKYSIEASAWFKESFANMASLVFLNETDNITNSDWSYFGSVANTYISYIDRGIYSNDFPNIKYGAFIFPLYIYENYGGWGTIKNIYQNYNSYSNEYEAICGANFDFIDAFSGMAAAVLYPAEMFENHPQTTVYAWPKPDTISLTTNRSVSGILLKMSARHYSFSSSTNIGSIYLTVDRINDTGTGLISKSIIEKGNGDKILRTSSHIYARYTIQVDNFGSSSAKSINIAVVGAFYSAGQISYNITISDDWL